jgi:hypothetical protein
LEDSKTFKDTNEDRKQDPTSRRNFKIKTKEQRCVEPLCPFSV